MILLNSQYSRSDVTTITPVSDLIDYVSETGVIVVADSVGTHRFSYRGNPKESQFKPRGICTDSLSHILICVTYAKTVQMIDKDGQFVSVLLTEQQGM